MKIRNLLKELEILAPFALQENYDNSGFLLGDADAEITGVLITVDITEAVLDEAIRKKCNVIISHHPFIFSGLKKITSQNPQGRMLLKAIQHEIAFISMHTNLDNVKNGINGILAKKIGLKEVEILQPKEQMLRKLVTFCPLSHKERVQEALFEAGAGHIGNYDSCSFQTQGTGSFRGNEAANPFVGEKGKIHFESEIRIEVIYPVYKEQSIVKRLLETHPYEEVAYDLYSLNNAFSTVGSGMVGILEKPVQVGTFFNHLKEILQIPCIRHSKFEEKEIQKVALCGGSGSFLIQEAQKKGVDIFLTGDLKYHDFQQASQALILADIGHYESEQFAKELIYSFISEKFSTFAILFSEHNTNFISYF